MAVNFKNNIAVLPLWGVFICLFVCFKLTVSHFYQKFLDIFVSVAFLLLSSIVLKHEIDETVHKYLCWFTQTLETFDFLKCIYFRIVLHFKSHFSPSYVWWVFLLPYCSSSTNPNQMYAKSKFNNNSLNGFQFLTSSVSWSDISTNYFPNMTDALLDGPGAELT